MPSALRVAVRLCVPAVVLLVSGCGPARDAFAPACPVPRLIASLADLTRYGGPGPTHDVTDLVMQARVTGVNGSCEPGDDKSNLAAKVQVSLSIQRGPAMQGRDADVPVFLAVTEADAVRDKKMFPLHLTFPPNVDRLTITSPEIDMQLPISSDKSGASYSIIAGFQLSPDELAANRQASGS